VQEAFGPPKNLAWQRLRPHYSKLGGYTAEQTIIGQLMDNYRSISQQQL